MRRLLIRPGAIGDFIVSLPAMEFLRADYTEVWTTDSNAPLARFADGVDTIIGSGLDSLDPSPQVLDRLSQFDSIVSWYGTNRPDFRHAMEHLPFQFHRALPHGEASIHAVDYYLAQAGAPASSIPRLPVKRDDHGFAVLHPFSGSERKNWPVARFRELAARLDLPVYWTAGPEEALEDATRFDNLWNLAQWLATASIFIGNDSGISHLAAACRVPVIALFGPTDPDVWAPRGEQARVVRSPDRSIEAIAVEEVLATYADMRRHP